MKVSVFLALAVPCVMGARDAPRLLEFSPGNVKWQTPEQVDGLAAGRRGAAVGFFDVTSPASRTLGGSGPQSFKTAGAIPEKPVQQEYVTSCFPSLSGKGIVSRISDLSALETRYYKSSTGIEASGKIASWYSQLRASRDDVTVETFIHADFPQPSVVATIEGSGPHADEVVILGGHLDSIGSTATGRSPGADDDGSGSSTVLEVFSALLANDFRPDRTVEFHAYAAEEVGLRGSQAIAAAYERRGVKVASMMQLDMVGYVTPEHGGPIGIITDYTDPDLNAFVRQLVTAYTDLTFEDSKCGYACSDHASFTKAGYRAAFPFETPFGLDNPNIHSANDTLAGVSTERVEQFARLGLGYVVEMAIV